MDKLQKYEAFKKQLQTMVLTTKQYEQMIKDFCKKEKV